MLKLFRYFKTKDWLSALLVLGLVVVQVWLELLMPEYTAKLTEEIVNGSPTMEAIWTNGGYMLLCALGSVVASIVCGFFVARIAANFAKTLRNEMFGKILTFSNEEMSSFSTPSLITRTTNDVVQLQMLIAMGLQVLVKAPVLAIWAICKISATSIEWTTATLIAVAVIVVLVVTLVLVCYPKFKEIQKLTDRLNDVTRENVSGVRVVRAFNAEAYQEAKFEAVNEKVTKNNLFTSRTMGLMMPVMNLCMNGLTLAIYWIGAILINRAEALERVALLGEMTAFTQYALQVVMAFIMIIVIVIMLPRSLVSAKRVSEVLETTPRIFGGTVAEGKGENAMLEVKNVSFSYAEGEEPTLSNVSFSVKRGETVALIGATGSGKTTLVNLIGRGYDVTEGSILLDGVDVREYTEEALHDKIAVAPQKAVLFKGDVRSNVAYGSRGEVSEERIQAALRVAQADFVYALEGGLESEVAQGGTNFSGGQKQRLSIARAIYKDADLMIFDDTFSALDYRTDLLVRRGIKEHCAYSTVLIVAQRIGTIMNADQIIVLDEGKIVGMGKHKELLESCPTYRSIALSQLRKEEL
ncbi:MAG: ABC transporter ATP-binding protein [Clostridia bacterium]|nr:ABC transporter ATP-binding protein [Clostridia bacterium]